MKNVDQRKDDDNYIYLAQVKNTVHEGNYIILDYSSEEDFFLFLAFLVSIN